MEKQIMINHRCNEITHKIESIINYLSLFATSDDEIICNFSLSTEQHGVVTEIEKMNQLSNLPPVKIESNSTNGKHSEYYITLHLQDAEMLLNIVEKYELNVVVFCDGVKMFLNDNDGDFIIISSNHKKYNSIKTRGISK